MPIQYLRMGSGYDACCFSFTVGLTYSLFLFSCFKDKKLTECISDFQSAPICQFPTGQGATLKSAHPHPGSFIYKLARSRHSQQANQQAKTKL